MVDSEVSMSSKRYTQEVKVEAVKQVTDRGHSVADAAGRLRISIHRLYAWRKHDANRSSTHPAASDQASELRRVKSELRRFEPMACLRSALRGASGPPDASPSITRRTVGDDSPVSLTICINPWPRRCSRTPCLRRSCNRSSV
ncbi:hypothetical protein XpopCFBP1817_04320 [Xanthomonas populi]|uniref:Transposase n=1 Tax=Xanthomonas populi TaxID=53414 RepID=A0A2S7EYQ9_9XANT|nr:hypothetical protein XpopCFBP1817_04320 [Xanthomonas populi]